jgi:4-amino-4-deoxy-L-arabinose transferase-like glycosyltransferase
MTPVRGQSRQLSTPPAAHWLHALAFRLGGHDGEDLDALVFDARCVSLVMALLLVASVYWAANAIGGNLPSMFAGLIIATLPAVHVAGRFATPEPITLAWATLMMAAALWAIRPLRPPAKLVRQMLGWLICGLALGMLLLTAGPGALPPVLAPLLLIVLLVPHRLGHALGLLAAAIVAALLVAPWAGYALSQDPEVWQSWLAQFNPPRSADFGDVWRLAGWRFALILLIVLPWTLWLPAAIGQPLSTSSSGSRQRMFIGWVWFTSAVLLVLFAPERRGTVEAAILLPSAAILFGQLFRQFADLSAEGRHARLWRVVRWPHAAALILASLAIPLVLQFQQWFVDRGYFDGPPVATMHSAYWAGAGAALLLLALLGAKYAVTHYPGRCVVTWAVWTVVAAVLVIIPATNGPAARNPLRAEAVALGGLGENGVYRLVGDTTTAAPLPGAVTFYADRPIQPINPDHLNDLRALGAASPIIVPLGIPGPEGATRIADLPALELTAWRLAPAASVDDAGDATMAEPPPPRGRNDE